METDIVGNTIPLVVIVGPTASGKTALAVHLAERFGGEIICADSRTVYKYMDIGTAKPTDEEQQRVPHWGLDLVEPGQPFSVADFKKYAVAKIKEIRGRGRIPFLVGGTGLYIDAILFDYKFEAVPDRSLRERLSSLSLEELHKYCIENNIPLPENDKNRRYVIRAIEREGRPKQRRDKPIDISIIVGISSSKEELRTRIAHRAEQIFDSNVVEEATLLGKKYGWENEAMTGNIYPLVAAYLDGQLTREEMKERFATLDWRLAKRQLTWFRRNPYIKWLSLSEAKKYLEAELASLKKS